MSKKNTKRYSPEFKARIALEAAQEQESLAQIGHRCGVHPVLVGQWKKQLLKRAAELFRREGASNDTERTQDELLKKIGELTVERDFLARGLRHSR
jgi:transposase